MLKKLCGDLWDRKCDVFTLLKGKGEESHISHCKITKMFLLLLNGLVRHVVEILEPYIEILKSCTKIPKLMVRYF